jgi:spore germination cell wall hydrolase CwlJ-like protein
MIYNTMKSLLALGVVAVMYSLYTIASSSVTIGDTGTPPPVTDIDITYNDNISVDVKAEVMCLAKNIYFEAGTESTAGKVAVGVVTMNRVEDRRWPSTICGVVEQAVYSQWWLEAKGKKVPVRHKCQFSWFCDGKSDNPYPGETWEESVKIAEQIFFVNPYQGLLNGATHYHATYVNPAWAKHFKVVARVDNHIFYR